MKQQIRRSYGRLLRGMLMLSAMAAMGGWVGPRVAARPGVKPAAVASLLPEVRLRKLHLVRPDLILYPLCYEVCC